MANLPSDIIGSKAKCLGSYNVCFDELDGGATHVSGGQFLRSAFVIPFASQIKPSFPCHNQQFALAKTVALVL